MTKFDLPHPTPFVQGRELSSALRALTTPQRAVYAAGYDRLKLSLVVPTNDQLAAIFRISTAYLIAARRLSPAERELVLMDIRPLIQPEDRIKIAARKIGTDAALEVLCNV